MEEIEKKRGGESNGLEDEKWEDRIFFSIIDLYINLMPNGKFINIVRWHFCN